MVIQRRAGELVVGTFGRAVWIADIAPLEHMDRTALEAPAHFFSPKPAVLYRTRYTYGATIEQLNGDMFFRAENPPFGATLWYLVRDASQREASLTVSDAAGRVIRRLSGPGAAGLHAVQWDLQPDDPPSPPRGLTPAEREAAMRVAPGRYTVRLDVGGVSQSTMLDVVPEGDGVQRPPVRK